jgi:SAM-dependent methyltransferase
MQAYSAKFAHVYNMRWSGYARSVAPRIMDFYGTTSIGRINKTMLDVCCGTGQLAVHFLEAGYSVVGLDSSEPMLHYARENAGNFVDAGRARFVQGNAGEFVLDDRFGLAVSTFDALIHLDNEEQLKGCFRSIFPVLVSGGFLVFDLNTPVGLRRWNQISMDDSGDGLLLITHSFYDGHGDKAWTQITGFVRQPDGLYERFDETVFNTVFNLARVKDMLLEIGWREVHFARIDDLKTPLAEPEKEGRVFIVASKPKPHTPV